MFKTLCENTLILRAFQMSHHIFYHRELQTGGSSKETRVVGQL